MYYKGDGVSQDKGEAAALLKRAAEQGNTEAQFILGNLYAQGKGVGQNTIEALRWFGKAHLSGHIEAGRFLGILGK